MARTREIPTVRLGDRAVMPVVGFGTWRLTGQEAYEATRAALELGYRHIDTATMYGNHAEIGRAVRDSGLDRGEVFITTKLHQRDAGRERETIERTLRELGTDYVDLWLVHWPPNKQARPDVWEHVVAAQQAGKARAIGVSNYSIEQIDELTAATGVTPSINQIPWSPADFDADLVAAHRERDVVLEGYSPFKRTNLDDPVLAEIAEAHGVTPTQVVLRWHLDTGVVAIPKSVNRDRIASNFDVAGFRLTEEEITRVSGLEG